MAFEISSGRFGSRLSRTRAWSRVRSFSSIFSNGIRTRVTGQHIDEMVMMLGQIGYSFGL
jgi:hypothetical protein